MATFKVFGIGELLWDDLPSGRQPGGAPANFAYVADCLGDRSCVLSRIGSDDSGDELLSSIGKGGPDLSLIQRDPLRPTGTASVLISHEDAAFSFGEDTAWDHLEATEEWLEALASADAVAFGTLCQRSMPSRNAIRELLGRVPEDALVLVDLNLRAGCYTTGVIDESLTAANTAKLNGDELKVVSSTFGIHGDDEVDLLEKVRERFDLDLICLTRGAESSLLVAEDEISDEEVGAIETSDPVGAGDAFAAALVHGLLREWSLRDINRFAGAVGSYVASRPGAMPDFSDFSAAE